MMFGNDERQLVGPILPTGLLQPYVLCLDRRHQIVEGIERGQVMKRCGDRELVVAVGPVGSEHAGEVDDAVNVRFVGVVAGVVAVGTLTVRLEDLVGQGQAAEDIRRDHDMSVRGAPASQLWLSTGIESVCAGASQARLVAFITQFCWHAVDGGATDTEGSPQIEDATGARVCAGRVWWITPDPSDSPRFSPT